MSDVRVMRLGMAPCTKEAYQKAIGKAPEAKKPVTPTVAPKTVTPTVAPKTT